MLFNGPSNTSRNPGHGNLLVFTLNSIAGGRHLCKMAWFAPRHLFGQFPKNGLRFPPCVQNFDFGSLRWQGFIWQIAGGQNPRVLIGRNLALPAALELLKYEAGVPNWQLLLDSAVSGL